MKALVILIGVIIGMLLGAGGMYLAMRAPRSAASLRGTTQPAAKLAPSDPLVGMWRTKIDMIGVTYDFRENHTFTLTFTNVPPMRPFQPGVAQEATGTWRVDSGKTLVMKNLTSTTPLTVVGEEESAEVLSNSADTLVLLNKDRKGQDERVTFRRVPPFVVGECDNPQVIGTWQDMPGNLVKLGQEGQVLTRKTNFMTGTGQWSQHGDSLRMILDLPYMKGINGWQHVRADQVYPLESAYTIVSISSDGNTMVLKPAGDSDRAPAPITYRRSKTVIERPDPNAPRRTGVRRY